VEMVADHFLVTLPPETTPEAFLKKLGLQATLITRVTSDASLYRVDLTTPSLDALPRSLKKGVEVPGALCEPDLINHTQAIPNDSYFLTKQWGLQGACSAFDPFRNVMQSYVGAHAEEAWDVRTSAASVVVAVFDSGIRTTHEDLAENIWNNPAPTIGDLHGIHLGVEMSKNAIGQAFYHVVEDGEVEDHYGHGTHCSGIIGAVGNNGVGVAGVAWKVQLMACKCQDDNGAGTVGEEIICMDYARNHGATIFNCSIGATMPSDAEYSAIIRAREAGIIVVASVGNEGADNSEGAHTSYPASYSLDNIVAVAASTGIGELASFSNYGAKSVHLAAPGENIFSTGAAGDDSYMVADGTSMAACFVTGTLALLREQFPMETYQSLKARLLAATDKYPALADKTISGGVLNIATALTQPYPNSTP
jgi:subtilisin family serine protease